MNQKAKPLYDLSQIKKLTPARIGLACAGSSISTHDILAFDLAHAKARDAVHLLFDSAAIASQLNARQIQSICVHNMQFCTRYTGFEKMFTYRFCLVGLIRSDPSVDLLSTL